MIQSKFKKCKNLKNIKLCFKYMIYSYVFQTILELIGHFQVLNQT